MIAAASARDLMTTEVVTVHPGAPIGEVARILAANGISAVRAATGTAGRAKDAVRGVINKGKT